MTASGISGTTISGDRADTGEGPSAGELLRTERLEKVFGTGQTKVVPITALNFSIRRGEMIAIIGPSGAGKSTLLHLLGALDTPTSGTVYFAGRSLQGLTEAELAEYRSRKIGFVWQRHHLLPDFTAAENVAMPLLVQGRSQAEAMERALRWLGEVGLADRAQHRAAELSGGEQQRVAIARALANGPELLLADEPTGDLDEKNAQSIFDLMQSLHRSHELTSILATHNHSLARRADRVYLLEHGGLTPAEGSFAAAASGAATAWLGARTPGERG
jgi:lipoprotein-releasing system ATP-binding protein